MGAVLTKNSKNTGPAAAGTTIDWKAGHGILSGTVNGTLGTLSTTALGHATGLPAGWALGAGAAIALTSAAAGWRQKLTRATLAFRATCWTTAGGWSSWALAHGGPWTWPHIAALATCGVAAGIAAPSRRGTRRWSRPLGGTCC